MHSQIGIDFRTEKAQQKLRAIEKLIKVVYES